jgi:hypothetical protein
MVGVVILHIFVRKVTIYYIEKENGEISLMVKKIQKGFISKSYIRKGFLCFLIHEEMSEYLVIQ